MPRPALPDQSSASWWQSRFRRSTPPCPARSPTGSLPALRSLQPESPSAAYALRFHFVSEVALAQRLHVLRPHHRLVIRTVAVHELAHGDFSVQRQPHFAGRRAILHLALLFVVLHGVQPVAHLVAPLVKRG